MFTPSLLPESAEAENGPQTSGKWLRYNRDFRSYLIGHQEFEHRLSGTEIDHVIGSNSTEARTR